MESYQWTDPRGKKNGKRKNVEIIQEKDQRVRR